MSFTIGLEPNTPDFVYHPLEKKVVAGHMGIGSCLTFWLSIAFVCNFKWSAK